MSLTQSRTEYRRKMAAHKAAKKAEANKNKKDKIYKPQTFTVTCRYCKGEGHKVGHFDKTLGRFVTTCVKAIDATKRKAEYNKRQRDKKSAWQNHTSQSVADETGSDGWSTTGSKNKVSAAKKTEKPVLKFSKNPFALDEDSEDEAVVSTCPSTRTPPPLSGAWTAGAPKVSSISLESEKDWKDEDVPSLPHLSRQTAETLYHDEDKDTPALTRSTGAPPPSTSPPPVSWGDAW
tara:strand:- start:611 stop:1312 length:702 start_codon:yes stop_codon:yes gene_type:complete